MAITEVTEPLYRMVCDGRECGYEAEVEENETHLFTTPEQAASWAKDNGWDVPDGDGKGYFLCTACKEDARSTEGYSQKAHAALQTILNSTP